MRRNKGIVGVLVSLALVGAACGGDDGGDEGAADEGATAETSADATPSTEAPADPASTEAPAEPAGTETEAPAEPAALPGALSIMAPADPGGGWDKTARSLQTVADPLIDGGVEVYNRPGAGGTVGLAEFLGQSGSEEDLMVMGSVMIGAIITNEAPVSLDDVTPIASLTTEFLAIAVPADSEYQTLGDLVAAFTADPTAISWGGGSAGGSDHQLVALVAQAAGVDIGGVNYVAHAGGGELLATLLSGAVSAGVSGVSEFREQVDAGALRILAVSSTEPVEGVDAPTIIESGLDVTLSNWRGVVAAPELSDADLAAVLSLVDSVVSSPEWQAELDANGWTEFYQAGDDFASFLDAEQERVTTTLRDIGLTA